MLTAFSNRSPQGALTAAVVVGIPVLAKPVIAIVTTKDADPKDKAAILRAVAELFRRRQR